MPSVKVANFFGGFPIKSHKETLKNDCPTVIVGTPGRLCQVCHRDVCVCLLLCDTLMLSF